MFKKLDVIRNISPRSFLKKIKPFTFSNKIYDGGLTKEQKYQINKSNKIYINGIRRQRSVIDVRKMEEDFEKSQQYKKNICKLPAINFHKINNKKKEETNDQNNSIIKQNNFFDDTVFIRTQFLHEKNSSQEKSRNWKRYVEKKNASMINIKKFKAEKNTKEKNETNDKEKNVAKTTPVEENNQDKAFWITDLKDDKKNEAIQ